MNDKALLLRIRLALALVIIGLVLSGLTTFPLQSESFLLIKLFGNGNSSLSQFVQYVHEGIVHTKQHYPFLFYGLDWLGFAHFAIALAFIAPFKNPTQHTWTIQWGILICIFCIPAIFGFGWMRRIPLFWSLIDCLFPLLAAVPLALAGYWTRELSKQEYKLTQK